jgi:hypothetical protein
MRQARATGERSWTSSALSCAGKCAGEGSFSNPVNKYKHYAGKFAGEKWVILANTMTMKYHVIWRSADVGTIRAIKVSYGM